MVFNRLGDPSSFSGRTQTLIFFRDCGTLIAPVIFDRDDNIDFSLQIS